MMKFNLRESNLFKNWKKHKKYNCKI